RVHTIRPRGGLLPYPPPRPDGCVSSPRADLGEDACTRAQPPMATVGPAHGARCLRWETAMAAPPVRQERRLGAASGEIAATVASVRSLTKHFDEPGALTRWLGLARPPVHALDDVTLDV